MAVSPPPSGQAPPRPTAEERSLLRGLLGQVLEWVQAFVGIKVAEMVWIREGTATTLNTSTRRVQVTLDPRGEEEPLDAAAEYGRPSWTASEIEGKRVLVFQRRKDGRVILDAVQG